MTWKLFIDDERFPITDDWQIARSSQEAIDMVQANGMPAEIAFDHDLGGDDTSMKFIWWFIDAYYDGLLLIGDLSYTIHSQNSVGVKNIRGLMDGFLKDIGRLK